jgi:hypothetical protein
MDNRTNKQKVKPFLLGLFERHVEETLSTYKLQIIINNEKLPHLDEKALKELIDEIRVKRMLRGIIVDDPNGYTYTFSASMVHEYTLKVDNRLNLAREIKDSLSRQLKNQLN